MKKIVKLKESDIQKILMNLQEEFGKSNEPLDISSLPDDLEIDVMEPTDEVPPKEMEKTDVKIELTLGQDPLSGEYFVFKDANTSNPKIVARGIY